MKLITIPFLCSAVLCLGVWAYDRDFGCIDHLFDFHLDTDRIAQDALKEREEKRQYDMRIEGWVSDLQASYGECGTFGAPDRDN